MTLSVGDALPDANFFFMGPDGPAQMTTQEVFAGKTIALFALPGAFTGTCHLKHLPGFLNNAAAFKAKGVDGIVCITVNDPFVVGAWQKDTGADGTIQILGDSAAEFTNATGMGFDGSAFGLGTRSQRYAALVKDGTVTAINIEESPGVAETSSAENLLKAL